MFRFAAIHGIRPRLTSCRPTILPGIRQYGNPDHRGGHDTLTAANGSDNFQSAIGVHPNPPSRMTQHEKMTARVVRRQQLQREEKNRLAKLSCPTALILNQTSLSLTRDDFTLLLPRGKHIVGWRGQGGLLRG
jgi:hypothetical protein